MSGFMILIILKTYTHTHTNQIVHLGGQLQREIIISGSLFMKFPYTLLHLLTELYLIQTEYRRTRTARSLSAT